MSAQLDTDTQLATDEVGFRSDCLGYNPGAQILITFTTATKLKFAVDVAAHTLAANVAAHTLAASAASDAEVAAATNALSIAVLHRDDAIAETKAYLARAILNQTGPSPRANIAFDIANAMRVLKALGAPK